MSNCFIILAAGQSKRFKSNKPKQYILYNNKPIYEHSVDKVLKSGLFKHVILVVKNNFFIKRKFSKKVKIIKGGKERSDSSLIALKYIKKFEPNNVLIHDAARPNFSFELLKKLIVTLKKNKAVVPVIKSKDSIKYKVKNELFNLNRNNSFLTQTPQAFRFKELYNLAIIEKAKVSDEAALFINNDHK